MAPIHDDLRRDVLGRATERPRLAAGLQLLREAEVYQLHVAFRVQQQILWFEIPVITKTPGQLSFME